MNLKIRLLIISVTLLLWIPACRNSGKKISAPDVSSIDITLKLQRFEKDLFSDTLLSVSRYDTLQKAYSGFLPCFYENIMQLGRWDSGQENSLKKMRLLLHYGGIRAAYDSVQLVYPDLNFLQKGLTGMLKYYRYYRPDDSIPVFNTFVSEYGYGIVDCGRVIGIGLDLFLGKNFSFYPAIGIPDYLSTRMDKAHLIPGIAAAMSERLIGTVPSSNTLLSTMILNGKKLYFEDLILPGTADYLKMAYSPEQENWCTENEGEVWAYLNGEGLLFETSRMKFIKFISEAPGTPGLPPEAPGNIGSWVGWQIVKRYMQKTHATLDELLEQHDDQLILNKSNYKPRRH